MSTYAQTRQAHEESIIRANLDPDATICPKCGRYVVDYNSRNGRKYGFCSVCIEKAKADAERQLQAELEARREYDTLRQGNNRRKHRFEDATADTSVWYYE